MPINTSGPVSLGGGTSGVSIAFEVGVGATTQISLNDTNVRTLAGVPSGQIVMPTNFYGKSNAFTFNRTISTNTQNYNLLNDMVANGYTNGSAFTANITIASGIYVWSDNTALAGFDTGNITGTGTINIVNSGFIIGRGGTCPSPSAFDVNVRQFSAPGGPAINTVRPMTITNNSFIAGGGGSGGMVVRAAGNTNSVRGGAGGGAGGGDGGNSLFITNTNVISGFLQGGAGGGLGASGSNGIASSGTGSFGGGSGGGGGRILPGVGGAARLVPNTTGNFTGAGGSGGNAGGDASAQSVAITIAAGVAGAGGGSGGSGGGGRAGGKGGQHASSGGGGGGWGAVGGAGIENTGATPFSGPGGAGGKAINTNGNAITFITTGTVYGAVN